MMVRPGGAPCSCGGSGCLEAEVFRLIDSGSAPRPAEASQLVSQITQSIRNSVDPHLIVFRGSMAALLEAAEHHPLPAEPDRANSPVAARGTSTDLAIGAADIAFGAFLADPLGASER